MPRIKKTMGRGAVVTILARLLHPRRLIQDTFRNMNKNKRLDGLMVLRLEVKKVGKKNIECVAVQSDEFKSGDTHIELHAATKHYKVVIEGPSEDFFVSEEDNEANTEVVAAQGDDLLPAAVIERVHLMRLDDEDITALRGQVETDNDNDPLPENIPNANDNNNTECTFADQWGHGGTCYRKMEGIHDVNPKLNVPIDVQPSLVDIFELLFPKQFLVTVMLPEMNEKQNLARYNMVNSFDGLVSGS
jgi:hypothetical protein